MFVNTGHPNMFLTSINQGYIFIIPDTLHKLTLAHHAPPLSGLIHYGEDTKNTITILVTV